MDDASRADDDDEVTPEDRLSRVRRELRKHGAFGISQMETENRERSLHESLAEVATALEGDCGGHRDLLERLKARLGAAIG
jgi:hypothetical protein